MDTLRFEKSKPESKTDNLIALFKLLAVQDPRLKPTWTNKIPELFGNCGFVDIEQDTQEPLPHVAFQFHEAGLMMHDLIARKTQTR